MQAKKPPFFEFQQASWYEKKRQPNRWRSWQLPIQVAEFKLQTQPFVFVWLKIGVMRFHDYCPDLIVFCQVLHHIRHG